MGDQRGIMWTWERWLTGVSWGRHCLSFPGASDCFLKFRGLSVWVWWAHARFGWQSGRSYSFSLEIQLFHHRVYHLSFCFRRQLYAVEGQWPWGGIPNLLLQWDQPGQAKETSCPAKGHTVLGYEYWLFLTVGPLDPWVLQPQMQPTLDQK